jgi:hypothetical protein
MPGVRATSAARLPHTVDVSTQLPDAPYRDPANLAIGTAGLVTLVQVIQAFIAFAISLLYLTRTQTEADSSSLETVLRRCLVGADSHGGRQLDRDQCVASASAAECDGPET